MLCCLFRSVLQVTYCLVLPPWSTHSKYLLSPPSTQDENTRRWGSLWAFLGVCCHISHGQCYLMLPVLLVFFKESAFGFIHFFLILWGEGGPLYFILYISLNSTFIIFFPSTFLGVTALFGKKKISLARYWLICTFLLTDKFLLYRALVESSKCWCYFYCHSV